MAGYDVKTPILKTVAEGAMTVLKAALAGNADVRQGALAMNACSNARRAVETDLRVRLATKKLKEAEA